MKKNIVNFCLFCGATTVAFLVAEIGLRMDGRYASYSENNKTGWYCSPYKNPMTGWLWTYRPNWSHKQQTREFITDIHTNSLGLRDIEWEKPKTKKRIACIGDSFTEGIGASNDSSYPMQLGALFGEDYEVMNCGMSGSDPLFGYMLLREKIMAYQPDIVFMAVNGSDVSDVMVRGGLERFHTDTTTHFKQGPWWELFYACSHAVRAIASPWYDASLIRKNDRESREVEARRIIENCMDRISEICKNRNTRLIFLFQVENENETIVDYAEKQGYESIDISKLFRGDARNFGWPIDGHYNAMGYGIWARGLHDYLISH